MARGRAAPLADPLPVVFDEVYRHVAAADLGCAPAATRPPRRSAHVVYMTDDPKVLQWAVSLPPERAASSSSRNSVTGREEASPASGTGASSPAQEVSCQRSRARPSALSPLQRPGRTRHHVLPRCRRPPLPRHQDYVHQLESLLRRLDPRRTGISRCTPTSRIEHHVRSIDRSHVRGVAMFSCSAEGFWEVIELPVRVSSQVVIEPRPTCASSSRCSMNTSASVCCSLTASGRGVRRRARRADRAHRRVRCGRRGAAPASPPCSGVTFRLFQDEPFDHLAVGAPPEIAAEITASLHPYLRERLVDRISLSVQASDDQVRRCARRRAHGGTSEGAGTRAAVARRRRRRTPRGRRSGADAACPRGAAGRASARVAGVSGPGWHCRPCGYLAKVGGAALVQRAHGADVRCRRTCD